MKNYYEVLGVSSDAKLEQIKSKFKELALQYHPDKGGDPEKMAEINDAYGVLSDNDKRRSYDKSWSVFQTLNGEDQKPAHIEGYLDAGDQVPFSASYRKSHQNFVHENQKKGVKLVHAKQFLSPFASNCYSQQDSSGINIYYHDIFSYVTSKRTHAYSTNGSNLPQKLTLREAVKIFINFLAGKYYNQGLTQVQQFLSSQISQIIASNVDVARLPLYEIVLAIINLSTQAPTEHLSLMPLLKELTKHTQKLSNNDLSEIIPLFYNKYFRNLCAYAQHLHWNEDTDLFDDQFAHQFDGKEFGRTLLESLQQRLSHDGLSDELSELIQGIKLFIQFDRDVQRANNSKKQSDLYREHAFHLLDWIPVFIDRTNAVSRANILMQIGIKFQQASVLEQKLPLKKADESLAMSLYLTAHSLATRAAPDVELYVNTFILQSFARFTCADDRLKELIPALQHRTLLITNVFPLFQGIQSTLALLHGGNDTLKIMRYLLNTMMASHEYNKTHPNAPKIDHPATTLLYQVYEACLKNWYQENYDADFEKKIRQELMDELLAAKKWDALDVETLLNEPWVMIDRDAQSWINPTRALPYPDGDDEMMTYSAFNGVELDQETGEFQFFLTPWSPEDPVDERLFTLSDLDEMLSKNLSGALLSLDPVDPDMPYHPFNSIRFAPKTAYDSQLFNTMLLTDYILKFLTTKQEVQGCYPFDQRSVDNMIKHLPAYLRHIIYDYHKSQNSGAIHRFWIEAQEIDLAVFEPSDAKNTKMQISVGELTMVVKKHRMERDVHGELKDVDNEEEGWPIYILTPNQMHKLEKGKFHIEGHAMVFVAGHSKLYYWDNNQVIKFHTPSNYRDTLGQLYMQPKTTNGAVIHTTKNDRLLVRITRDMAEQSGLPHKFSPEFIFAHDFTRHYEEFAQYLPEFGRLRELSKMAAVVRYLDGIRQANLESISAIDSLLTHSVPSPQTEAYQHYHQAHQKVVQQVSLVFQQLRADCSDSALKSSWRQKISEVKSQLGTLIFDSQSYEVTRAFESWVRDVAKKNNYRFSTTEIRRQLEPQRAAIAEQLSTEKQSHCRSQLEQIFSERLIEEQDYDLSSYIDSFINGDIAPLVDGLVQTEKKAAQREIHKKFPHSVLSDVAQALNDHGQEAAKRVGQAKSFFQLREVKTAKEKLKAGFTRINFGEEKEAKHIDEECFWVPASVRHEVKQEEASQSRYSFFVYGGVNVQPKINVVQGGNTPMGGRAVGGGAFNRGQITKGYQDHHIASNKNKATKNHALWGLAGINVNSRINRIYLPKTAEQHPTRSIHSGRHTNSYSVNISNRMDVIVQRGKAAGWSQTQYREATRKAFAEVRQELRSGNVGLNKNHRPWATKW